MTLEKREALNIVLATSTMILLKNPSKPWYIIFKKKMFHKVIIIYYVFKSICNMELQRICHEMVFHSNYLRRAWIKYVNSWCGLGRHTIAWRFKVHYWTISRNLQRRTSIVIRKRRKAPKMNNENNKFEHGKTVVSYTENYWMDVI